jgi:hypothetical protein
MPANPLPPPELLLLLCPLDIRLCCDELDSLSFLIRIGMIKKIGAVNGL